MRRAKRDRKKRKKRGAVDGETSPPRRRVLRSRAARSRARGRRCSCSRTPLQLGPRARPRTQSLASRATEHVKKRRAEPTFLLSEKKNERVRVCSTTRGQEPKIDMRRRRNKKCSTYSTRHTDRQLVARDWRARNFLFYIKIWQSESRTDIFVRLIARAALRFRALLARTLDVASARSTPRWPHPPAPTI